jgi:hypothetical protein
MHLLDLRAAYTLSMLRFKNTVVIRRPSYCSAEVSASLIESGKSAQHGCAALYQNIVVKLATV